MFVRCFSDEPLKSAMTDERGASTTIDLAHEPDFVLGGLQVSPSGCRVTNGGGEERVEPRVMEVLVVLVRNAGRTVTREQLIDTCWEGRAVSDDAVTRVIARVRALGRNADPPHFNLETIPKVGFRLAAGGPAAVHNSLPPASPPASPKFDRRNLAAAAVTIAVLLSVLIWLITGRQPVTQSAAPDRVAIVAFATLGASPELVTLARKAQDAAVQRLTEAGITVVMTAPGGPTTDVRELQLEGSIEKAADRYAVRTSLSVRPGGLALWSERFERKAGDVRGLEEEVAHTIARAASLCLKGYAADTWRSASEEHLPILFEDCLADGTLDVERQMAAARRLVAALPDRAMAHGRLALAFAEQSVAFAHLPEQTKALGEAALGSAKKALELDPNDPSAHLALGTRTGRTDFAIREQYLRRAIDTDPQNIKAIRHYGKFLLEVGRRAAAREVFARLERWPATAMYRAFIDAMNGDAIAAERQLEQLAVFHPAWARDGRRIIVAFWEEPRAAIVKLPELSAAQPRDGDACIIAHVGALVRANGRPVRGLPDVCRGLDVDWRVRLLARQGDVDGAFALLEGPWPVTRPHMFLFYPEMKSVRDDPRFMPLAARLGLVAYWSETGYWPDFCAEADAPYDCRAHAGR